MLSKKGEFATNQKIVDNSDEPWKSYVGLMKIKEDLVYDKNSGELIDYVNLDKVGNEMLNFENNSKGKSKSEVAKYLLVLMMRGICTQLTFPLASFASTSIIADVLYPIVWN